MRAQARSRLVSFLPVSLSAPLAACLALVTITGCNAVTGAGSLRLVEDSEETTDGSGGGGGAGSGGGSAGGGAPTACMYPAGPYGNQLNDIISPDLTWQGYAVGSTTVDQVTEIKWSDYLDCDGSKGINAILMLQSATWCGICDGEAQQLNERMDGGWKDMGIQVITFMIEDASSKPATTATAFQWKSMPSHDLQSSAVVADPNFSFAPKTADGTIGLPVILVVDPRTMEIVSVQQGASGSYPELEALAAKNSKAQ